MIDQKKEKSVSLQQCSCVDSPKYGYQMSLMSQLPFVTNLHGKFVTVVGGILTDVFVLLITK